MKLLIVLGLFPLFSAQQGFPQGFMMGFPQGQARSQGNPQKEYNSNSNNIWGFDFNNMNNMNNGLGMITYNSNGNNNNQGNGVFSLDKLNAGLIQQLRFMTDSLVNMLQQVAKDPRTNEVFKVMDKICVSNMDETIEILKVGSNAAEKALLDADQLLDSAVAGKLPNNGQKNKY